MIVDQLKIIKKNQFKIFLIYAGFAYMILDQNLLTLILSEKKNFDISTISFFELILQISTFVLEIPSGIIGDFVSKRMLLVGARISYILYAIILYISGNLYMIMFAFVLLGISESLISGTEESIIAEFNDKEQVKKYMYFSTIVQISTIASILLGGCLFEFNWKYIYIIMIVAQIVSIIAICFIKKTSYTIVNKNKNISYIELLKSSFEKKSMIKVILFGTGFGAIYSVYMIYLPLILSYRNLSSIQISFFLVMQMTGSFLLSFAMGKFAKDKDAKKICIYSGILFILGGVMIFSENIFINLTGAFISCVGGNIFFPSITSIINTRIPNEIRAMSNSIVNIIQTVFMCLALGGIGFIAKYY